MKKWQGSFWTVLTLIALFAATLPALAWACPMTGQIGDAAAICKSMMPQTGISTAQPCADPRRCCKPLTLPSHNERHENTGAAQSRTIGAPGQPLKIAPATTSATAVLPSSSILLAAPQRSSLRPAAFLFPLRSQHRPHAVAGRAPPVL
ncbi:MAG TPA: hypothetical protein VF600_05845 [Abditibacteriaceae bacterium]|jgi:hypothetical protein